MCIRDRQCRELAEAVRRGEVPGLKKTQEKIQKLRDKVRKELGGLVPGMYAPDVELVQVGPNKFEVKINGIKVLTPAGEIRYIKADDYGESMSSQSPEQQYQNLAQQLLEELKTLLTAMPAYAASETSARLAYSFIKHLITDAAAENVSIDPKLLTLITGALDKAMKETIGNISAPSASVMSILSTIGGLIAMLKPQQSGEKQ